MKPFVIENGRLKINVSDLHKFLEMYNLKFSSVSDISVMPIGVIIQCEAVGDGPTEAQYEELLSWTEDFQNADAGNDDPIYPVEHCYFSENEMRLTVVPAGAPNYVDSFELTDIPEHFAAGGEVENQNKGMDYVIFNGKTVHLLNDERHEPIKSEVMFLINEAIAGWVSNHLENMNPKLFDKGFAYNMVVNSIRESTEKFKIPFVVTENSINEIIEKTFE